MKKILVTAFENKEGNFIKPPANLRNIEISAYEIPIDKLSDIKELDNHSVQGSYSSNVIVTGMIIER